MSDFDDRYKHATGFRKVAPDLRPLVAALHSSVEAAARGGPRDAVVSALVALIEFLASERGRTDANCCVVDSFFADVDASALPDDVRAVVSDLSGALHDAIYAPTIAANFECLPEQLLERARKLVGR